jgi:polyisoprenoid-binding protein YceI
MLRSLLILTTAIFMSTAFAADKKEKKASAKDAKTETLAVDAAASSVVWVGSKKVGDSKHTGHIKVKEGRVELKDGKLTGGDFTIDMTSITNDDLKDKPDYQTKLVTHLKSDDFFKVDKNPTSEFKITTVKEKDGKPWVIGKLTLAGKTETVEFPATIETKGGVTTGKAKIEIDRTKWGVIYGAGNLFKELTADKVINNNFELDLNIVAKSNAAAAPSAATKK